MLALSASSGWSVFSFLIPLSSATNIHITIQQLYSKKTNAHISYRARSLKCNCSFHLAGRLLPAALADCIIEAKSNLSRLSDIDLGLLSSSRQSSLVIWQRLVAKVNNLLALKLESKNTITWALLASWLGSQSTKNWCPCDGGADRDVVVAWHEVHIVDVETADVGAVEEVDEGGVTDLEGEDGWVGDGGVTVEVVCVGEGDVGAGDLEPLEAVKSWVFG